MLEVAKSLEQGYQKLRECETKLTNIERLHALNSRWLLNSSRYLTKKVAMLESHSRANWFLKLESLARER